MTNASNELWYKHPAKTWVQALLLGNGSLGAAFWGKTDVEAIDLNLDTLWSGYPNRETFKKENPAKTFEKARDLSLNNENFKAQELLEKDFFGSNSQYYLPLGKLVISSKSNLKPRNYVRKLDLKTAVHTVSYTIKKTQVKSEAFVSAPNDVMVMRTTANGDEKINISVTMQNELRHSISTDGEFLRLEGICPSEIEDEKDIYLQGNKKGISFCCLCAFDTDGKIKFKKNNAVISDASFVTIYLGANSSFDKWNTLPNKKYVEPCEEKIRKAKALSFKEIKDEHVKDYKNYYDRVSFDLGDSKKSGVVTSTRLLDFLTKKNDVELYSLLFNFGRYLAICASRPNSQAMNLQGIWTYKKYSPWRSNYTVNINTQMNYWPLLSCSMPELCLALNSLIEDLSKAGESVAEKLYNARGFTCHHNVDLWRICTPVPGSSSWSFWPLSGAWFTRHLFEYYEYTNDIDFLRKTAYPIILKSAKFCIDMLVADEKGNLIACPSTSPENFYFDENKNKVAISQTSTMTMSIIKDNLQNALNCADILGDDDDFLQEIRSALPRLLPFKIGSDGSLLEWYEQKPEVEPHHRHVSHLYGLFPANLIDFERTPQLVEAAKKTLENRGDKGTGWSLGWKINFQARLRDGNHALSLINNQLRYIPNPEIRGRGGTYPNMLDAHPPFQIDGNFGAVSGILQMLVQSFGNRAVVLPALPDEWQNGAIKGVSIKGGAKIDIEWENGKLKSLFASGEGQYEFVYGEKCTTANLSGDKVQICF